MQRKKITKVLVKKYLTINWSLSCPNKSQECKKKIIIEAKRVAAQLQLMSGVIGRQIADLIKRMDSD